MAEFKVGDTVQVIGDEDDPEDELAGEVGVVVEIKVFEFDDGDMVGVKVQFKPPLGQRYMLAEYLTPADPSSWQGATVKPYDAAIEAQKWLEERHRLGTPQRKVAPAVSVFGSFGKALPPTAPPKQVKAKSRSFSDRQFFSFILALNLAAILVFYRMTEDLEVTIIGLMIWGMGAMTGWMWGEARRRTRK